MDVGGLGCSNDVGDLTFEHDCAFTFETGYETFPYLFVEGEVLATNAVINFDPVDFLLKLDNG